MQPSMCQRLEKHSSLSIDNIGGGSHNVLIICVIVAPLSDYGIYKYIIYSIIKYEYLYDDKEYLLKLIHGDN